MQQPNRQRRELMQEVVAPRCTVVHQHALGQAITPKGHRQLLLYRRGPLIRAGLETKRVPRMIIEHGKRMAALAIAQKKIPLEVHLPQLIRSFLFETLKRAHRFFRGMLHTLMSQQDLVNGTFGDRSFASSRSRHALILRAPHPYRSRTANTFSSMAASLRRGECFGRRERSASPPTPLSRYRSRHL